MIYDVHLGQDYEYSIINIIQGYVTHVKDQKHCGSCWAFSATAGVSAWEGIRSGKVYNLSEQHLVDCDRSWNSKSYETFIYLSMVVA